MVFDINKIKSHPDKFLLDHIQGVRDNTKKLTNSRIAELVAVFHDLGKINPYFQNKLDPLSTGKSEYSNHAYLSAFAFFCAFAFNRKNLEILKQFLNVKEISQNDIIALTVSIAKHHGNLPDFTPSDLGGSGTSILSKSENYSLFKFLDGELNSPLFEFANHFFKELEDFSHLLSNPKIQKDYAEKLIFWGDKNQSALDFFIDFQFSFASVLHADKSDAGKIGNSIDKQLEDVRKFAPIFDKRLTNYLSQLNQDSGLNKLRTTIRNNAIANIKIGLDERNRVFDLTSATGSGKTLMMLALALEIMKLKGEKRIIYALPFLSITEQVENEVLKIFKGFGEFIRRIDSKSENKEFEKIQNALETNPTEENILKMSVLVFQENTFAYPFVITTFVRFFETLLSNKNSELLKLPNFSNCIFLLDEIQSLPPRLYGFFIAYINKFCEKFNSYAIISTATQPNLEIPKSNNKAQLFFSNYKKPYPLLPLHYFENKLFNRYQIHFYKNPFELDELSNQIRTRDESCLVILNTIDDTKDLYNLLKNNYSSEELLLLNTHFTPRDRKLKIYLAKRRLRENKKTILISTQLIEAGVDIDFPVLYRDFATVSSIIQSAGRCNRNGKLVIGKVYLFVLQKNGKNRSEIIYQGKDSEILRFTKQSFTETKYEEKDLLRVQQEFFNQIQSELNWGKHTQVNPRLEFDFIKDIGECMYDKIGKFQLIDSQIFGEEYQYYVSKNTRDEEFEVLLELNDGLLNLIRCKAGILKIKLQKSKIQTQLRKISARIVQIRLKPNDKGPTSSSDRSSFGLFKISNTAYSFDLGVDLKGNDCII